MLSLRHVTGLALAIGLFPIAGCGPKAPDHAMAYTESAESIAKAAFDPYDLNKDGKLDPSELAKAPHFKEYCARTQRKTLSLTELTERITAYQTTASSTSGMTIKITRKDVPYANADVEGIPEDFHKGYPTLKGKTDSSGTVILKTESNKIPYGFYKISVTKEGENVPGNFNASTSLKIVFFPEAGGGRGGPIEFRLTN